MSLDDIIYGVLGPLDHMNHQPGASRGNFLFFSAESPLIFLLQQARLPKMPGAVPALDPHVRNPAWVAGAHR